MKLSFQRLSRRKAILTFIITLALALAAGLAITFRADAQWIISEREDAAVVVEIETGRISHVLDNQLSINYALRALLEEGHGVIEHFDEIMPGLTGGTSIRNIALAPGGVVSQVWPLVGNEDALGHDLLKDPDRVLEASIAMNSRLLTLSGPYELKQGGLGVIGRLPVYLSGADGADYFWGFTCVTIDIPDGLAKANLYALERQGYAYELWRVSPDTDAKQVIMRSGAPLAGSPEEENMSLPNSTWTLSVTPIEGWRRTDIFLFGVLLSGLFALLCALLGKKIAELAISRRELQITLRQQTDNYQLLSHLNEDLRVFRHDIRNHILGLTVLLEQKDVDGAKKYVDSMSGSIGSSLQIVNTENYVFDALLAHKLGEAEAQGIRVGREVLIDRVLHVENRDWGILLGNALDNAIEACARSGSADPCIHFSVRCMGTTLHGRISNTAHQPEGFQVDGFHTEKADRRNHGLGLSQIRSVVKKYHGVLDVIWKDGVFTLSFLLEGV